MEIRNSKVLIYYLLCSKPQEPESGPGTQLGFAMYPPNSAGINMCQFAFFPLCDFHKVLSVKFPRTLENLVGLSKISSDNK